MPQRRRIVISAHRDNAFGVYKCTKRAEEIKERLAVFLRDELKLELSADKTLITHGRTKAARFLGYDISIGHNDTETTRGRRTANGQVRLRVPRQVIKDKCAPYLHCGKPAKQTPLISSGDHAIVATFGAVYRGVIQYYLLAEDVWRLHRLQWAMETSMLKTLAARHRSTVSKMAARYKAKIQTPDGLRTGFEARIERPGRQALVARFGGIPLRRQRTATLADRQPTRVDYPHKELLTRLLADRCEICGNRGEVQVHHIAKLARGERRSRIDTHRHR